jgi:oligopeptide transport system substrate-binding protein
MSKGLFLCFVAGFLACPLGAAIGASELRAALEDEPHTLDPSQSLSSPEIRVLNDLLEGLVRRDVNGNIVPALAVKWTNSPDGRSWTFVLRPDARWSNGVPVIAADFIYAWRRALMSNQQLERASRILLNLRGASAVLRGQNPNDFGMTAPDNLTLEINFTDPVFDLVQCLDDEHLYPLPSQFLGNHKQLWSKTNQFVGNGPYRLTEWRPNGQIILVRSDTYWDQNAAKIDKVSFIPIEDSAAQFKRFRTNEIDVTTYVPSKQLDWIHANLPNQLVTSPSNSTLYLIVNINNESWTRDAAIRRALSLAIDRERLATKVLNGVYSPSEVYVPPATPGYHSPGPADWPPTQPERESEAKRLWREAGSPRPAKIKVDFADSDKSLPVLHAIAEMWRRVLGVEMILENVEFAKLTDLEHRKSAALTYEAWVSSNVESFIDRFDSRVPGADILGYNSPRFLALIDRTHSSFDPDARAAFFSQAETELLRDAVVIPLFLLRQYSLVSPKVKGYRPDNSGRYATRDLEILP